MSILVKAVNILDDELIFSDGTRLFSHHDPECCESHYLFIDQATLDDCDGLEFDLFREDLVEKVPGFGIRLVPINGHPVSIPGYGYNNGYYSANLTLVIRWTDGRERVLDISDCQEIDG